MVLDNGSFVNVLISDALPVIAPMQKPEFGELSMSKEPCNTVSKLVMAKPPNTAVPMPPKAGSPLPAWPEFRADHLTVFINLLPEASNRDWMKRARWSVMLRVYAA